MDVISLLITLLVAGLILYLIYWVMTGLFHLPTNIAQIVILVLALVVLLGLFGGYVPRIRIGG